jgi:hypothetical protein
MTLIHTDSRGRVSLGRILEANRDYRVIAGAHGRITLDPVTVISDYERAILADEELVGALDRENTAVERGETIEVRRRQR